MADTYDERQRRLDDAIKVISDLRDTVGDDLESLQRNINVAKRIAKECLAQFEGYEIKGTNTDAKRADVGQIALFPDPPLAAIEEVLNWLIVAKEAFMRPVPLLKGYERD